MIQVNENANKPIQTVVLYGPDSSEMKVCVTTQGEEQCPPEAKGIQNG